MGSIEPDKVYTINALARELEIKERTIRERITGKGLPAVKLFSRYYLKGSDVIKYIRERGESMNDIGDW